MHSSNSHCIRKLAKDACEEDISSATGVMVEAFRGDKINTMLVGGHTELFPSLFGCQFKSALIGGSVYVAETKEDGIVGAAIWFGPGESILGSEEQAEAGFTKFMKDLGKLDPDMPKWWKSYFMPTSERFTNEMLGPGYKLSGYALILIGVLPEKQRQGLGSALIQVVENEAASNPDSTARHLSLETETEGARAFYKSLGFKERGMTHIEGEQKYGGSEPMWCLSKDLV